MNLRLTYGPMAVILVSIVAKMLVSCDKRWLGHKIRDLRGTPSLVKIGVIFGGTLIEASENSLELEWSRRGLLNALLLNRGTRRNELKR